MKVSDAEIKKYEFKPNLPIGFEILSISDLYRKSKNIITNPHRTNFYNIIWIQKGNPIHHINFSPVNLLPNSFLFVAKDCVQFFDNSNDYDGKVILFTEEFYCRDIKDSTFLKSTILYNDLYGVFPIELRHGIEQFNFILNQMEIELEISEDKFHPLILKYLLSNLIMLAEREKMDQGFKEIKPGPELRNLTLFKELLEKNFKVTKAVSQYASAINISEKTLNKATTTILNKTPKEMIDERVILEAKLLLAYKDSIVKSIAYDLGFEELTNFIKYFRRHTLATPAEYRESL